jgi:transposase-like protein
MLSAAAASSSTAVSTWQANAGVVNVACAGSRKSLAVLAGRMQATGTKYAEAGTGYTATDEDGAARSRGLLG